MSEKPNKLHTEAYKGVRDFFPADMAIQNKIFDIWKKIAREYGYEEYNASILEPAELYRAKTGEEIVNEQTYTFTDRGDREVTLRPEMTPTVARMVAQKKRELIFPLRWYSIPNLFRYEQPQRGRLREHWQLNVDIFGIESIDAEIEVINIAYDITKAYGLKDKDFEIRINNRKLMSCIFKQVFNLNEEVIKKISRLIDKKNKISKEVFERSIEEFVDTKTFIDLLNSKNFDEFISHIPKNAEENEGIKEIHSVIRGLNKLGINNVRFDPTLMRGFDYYTGTIFEIYDQNPINKRSIFGGGRYDDLLSIFGGGKVPAVGFGAGDVIARDLLETYDNISSSYYPAEICICVIGEQNVQYAMEVANKIRQKGTRVAVDFSGKKIGDQISSAVKRNIPKVICIGDEEVKTGKLKIKTLDTGEETEYADHNL